MAPRSFHDRPKTAPVQLAGPVALQLPQVVGSAVPLVREKAVLGVADVGPRHEPIPEYLRDDGRRGDGQAQPVALDDRSEEHTSELQSPCNLVCRLLLEKKKKTKEDAPSRSRSHSRLNSVWNRDA